MTFGWKCKNLKQWEEEGKNPWKGSSLSNFMANALKHCLFKCVITSTRKQHATFSPPTPIFNPRSKRPMIMIAEGTQNSKKVLGGHLGRVRV